MARTPGSNPRERWRLGCSALDELWHGQGSERTMFLYMVGYQASTFGTLAVVVLIWLSFFALSSHPASIQLIPYHILQALTRQF